MPLASKALSSTSGRRHGPGTRSHQLRSRDARAHPQHVAFKPYAVFLLPVQVYETLQILLQEGRTHALNGDTIAVAELKHRVVMHIGSNRGSQFLHIMNVGELVELDRVVLWIEVVDRLRALARVEHKRVVAGTADGDGGRIGVGSRRRVEDDRAP